MWRRQASGDPLMKLEPYGCNVRVVVSRLRANSCCFKLALRANFSCKYCQEIKRLERNFFNGSHQLGAQVLACNTASLSFISHALSICRPEKDTPSVYFLNSFTCRPKFPPSKEISGAFSVTQSRRSWWCRAQNVFRIKDPEDFMSNPGGKLIS